MRLLHLSHSQVPALVQREGKQLHGAHSPTLVCPQDIRMLKQWLWREQRSQCTGTATCTEPSHSLWGQTGLPSLGGCTGSGPSRQENVERVVGSGRNISKRADMGFKCCLDAKVILLSEEPCGIISCSPAELTLAMLKLQHRQESLHGVNTLCLAGGGCQQV